jgi:hypothetical protein
MSPGPNDDDPILENWSHRGERGTMPKASALYYDPAGASPWALLEIGRSRSAVRQAAASRSRARMTVLADQGAPVGVTTLRALSSAAICRADMP